MHQRDRNTEGKRWVRFEKPKTVKACSLQQIVWRPIPDIVEEEPLNLSALCICRQLYAEAALLPYALIKFVLVDEVLLPSVATDPEGDCWEDNAQKQRGERGIPEEVKG